MPLFCTWIVTVLGTLRVTAKRMRPLTRSCSETTFTPCLVLMNSALRVDRGIRCLDPVGFAAENGVCPPARGARSCKHLMQNSSQFQWDPAWHGQDLAQGSQPSHSLQSLLHGGDRRSAAWAEGATPCQGRALGCQAHAYRLPQTRRHHSRQRKTNTSKLFSPRCATKGGTRRHQTWQEPRVQPDSKQGWTHPWHDLLSSFLDPKYQRLRA